MDNNGLLATINKSKQYTQCIKGIKFLELLQFVMILDLEPHDTE